MRWIIVFSLFLVGCATVSTRLPDLDPATIESEQDLQGRTALAEIERLRDKLSRISAPIMRENADLCDQTHPVAGFITAKLDDYPDNLKPIAQAKLQVKEDPTIIYVRPGSPADMAGLEKGDQIQSITGRFLKHSSKRLEQHLSDGTPLTIIRDDKEPETLVLDYETHCDFNVKLRMSSAINAYATGRSMIMTSGMMDFVETDEELAYILGHELAHNTHGHIRKSITNYILSLRQTKYTRPFEAEADYVGLYYAARAGYSLNGVEDMWRRLSRLSTKPIYKAKTHPTYPNRYVFIGAARDEILAKQRAGEPLLPNPKSDTHE